jgi:hypothetical protein
MRTVTGRDGEEMEAPEQSFLELGDEDAARLQAFVCEAQAYRDGLPATSSSEFLRLAMNALLKAVLSDGMEQLLWQIIAIEAVLGEVKEGESTRSLLARRLGNVLAPTGHARDEIAEAFNKLYGFRSDLVHGRRPGPNVFRGHLSVARRLALSATLWALRTYASLQVQTDASGAPPPKRQDLLRLADVNT